MNSIDNIIKITILAVLSPEFIRGSKKLRDTIREIATKNILKNDAIEACTKCHPYQQTISGKASSVNYFPSPCSPSVIVHYTMLINVSVIGKKNTVTNKLATTIK